MKEERFEDVVDKYFETHDACTMQELYHYIGKYRKKNKCYVPYDRDELYHLTNVLKTYYFDDKAEVLRKQEEINCPCCGTMFRKYPDELKFMKIKAYSK
jgi:hypothetical protein